MTNAMDDLSVRFPLTFPEMERQYIMDAIRAADCIVEYGSGGSTWFAASLPGKKIVSVESDRAWAAELRNAIIDANLPSNPKIVWADIGPTTKWGRPDNFQNWHKFSGYSTFPWVGDPSLDPDLVLIDGRFRPACFVATAISIKRPTLVIVDDYIDRPEYHKIENLAVPVERVGRMAVFRLSPLAAVDQAKFFDLLTFFFEDSESAVTIGRNFLSFNEQERLSEDYADLKKKYWKVRDRSDVLQRKYRNLKRFALPLSVPTAILLAPFIFPVYYFYRLLRKNRLGRAEVYMAFQIYRDGGPRAALSFVKNNTRRLPTASLELFKSMDAKTDKEWLALTNTWAHPRGAPRIDLEKGDVPRFHRITFEPVPQLIDGDLVTVIIPCFNAQMTVERAVTSILKQSWRNIEVIAVNDASTDNTGAILDAMTQQFPRLRVLHNTINVGPYVSKNRALRLAHGRYITGHDADDLAFPDRIATQMQPILNDPSCWGSLAHMVRMDESGRPCQLSKVGPSSYDGVCRIASISLLVSRDLLIEKAGYWDSVRYGADSELLARMETIIGKGPILINKAVMLCLWSEDSLTGNIETGVKVTGGLSPTREAYRNSWRLWHKSSHPRERHVEFPQASRQFDAPQSMIVPFKDVELLLVNDPSVVVASDPVA